MFWVVMIAGCGASGGDWSPLVVNDDAPAPAPRFTDAGHSPAWVDAGEMAVAPRADGGDSLFESVVDAGLVEDTWPVFAGEGQRRYPSDATFSDGQMAHWRHHEHGREKPAQFYEGGGVYFRWNGCSTLFRQPRSAFTDE